MCAQLSQHQKLVNFVKRKQNIPVNYLLNEMKWNEIKENK